MCIHDMLPEDSETRAHCLEVQRNINSLSIIQEE